MIRIVAQTKAWIARRSFERAVRDPARRQSRVWEATLAAIRRGTFWPAITGSSELRDFPITDYGFYQQVFESDLARNDHTRLTGEKIIFWAESSGTTGSVKHFPITRLYQEQFQKVNLPFASSVFGEDSDFFKNS